MFDFNDAQQQMSPQGELIPDGVFSRVKLNVRPGGTNGAVPMDAKLLKSSDRSDALMLNCELTLLDGPYARRKFWQNFTVAGGRRDDKGDSIGWNIAKSSFRAMIDSATGLDPKDETPAACAKRKLEGLRQLDGIVFAARIMIEPKNDDYAASNRIANVVVPGDPEYAKVIAGQPVPPDPVNAAPRKSRADGGAAAPAWSQPQASAQGPAVSPEAKPAASIPQWLNS
ncbi:hypothetical protein [Aestuariivirga sp.]|uniref:hypothetical protein n=1 Tax=Aestuariivirga sp. TaxID=2650926 RepID=UPI003593D81C